MAETPAERRQCPTRPSGPVPLIAHWITLGTCAERQRRLYHKCFTCSYRGKGANETPVVALPHLRNGTSLVPKNGARVLPIRDASSAPLGRLGR